MAPSKTPGSNNAASDTFLKQQAEGKQAPSKKERTYAIGLFTNMEYPHIAKGLGADNAPAHKEAPAPGEAPVASDSGIVSGGNATNVPGEKGLKDVPVSEERNNETNGNTMT